MVTNPKDVKQNIIKTLREELLADVTLANNLLLELNRYLDQLRNCDPEMLRLETLGDHPQIKFSEIRLKMNLPDHRSVLTDQEDQAKMEMETPRSSRVNSPPNAHS
ncbi:hypothetical protein Tco_0769634 [Tanacetum coccineum]|uniref:Uncharacterized protein n=1 Tax=Tanacetum coccineum TaxID=301880 RepID=A0ABQ4Z9X5_9ASTR